MSFHISADDVSAAGGQQKGVSGAGTVNSSGTITLQKTAPGFAPAHNKYASLFNKGPAGPTASPDILALGTKRWINANRASARRPLRYQSLPKPRPGAARAGFRATLKLLQPLLTPPPLLTETLSIKSLPSARSTLVKRAAGMALNL